MDSREGTEVSVMAVLAVLDEASELPSAEYRVERLCFEGVRSSALVGRDDPFPDPADPGESVD